MSQPIEVSGTCEITPEQTRAEFERIVREAAEQIVNGTWQKCVGDMRAEKLQDILRRYFGHPYGAASGW
jgi:hypothetical protein